MRYEIGIEQHKPVRFGRILATDMETVMQHRPSIQRASRLGFTLVELLVVIAIIGVLVALLLPAVQAAREAARRTQCTNQVRQMMLSMLNHESSRKAFPSGGIDPWPKIQDYLTGPDGTPYGPEKQCLGWAFQILPYLEGGNTYNLKTDLEIDSTIDPMFNCPSKRAPTRYAFPGDNGNFPYLMDYAAAVPYPSAADIGRPMAQYRRLFDILGSGDTRACGELTFWGGKSLQIPRHARDFDPNKDVTQLGIYTGFHGVIVRSNMVVLRGEQVTTNFYTRISFNRIEDGSSNTMVLGEKRLEPSLYDVGDWHDDKGWAGGWDPDGLRSTVCEFGPDEDTSDGLAGYRFGSAHAAGMNAGFADGSAHFLNYDIDQMLFNHLGHRADGTADGLDGI
jgi:prepilin-type N-terminal cleavage/methylation domain-containing protein